MTTKVQWFFSQNNYFERNFTEPALKETIFKLEDTFEKEQSLLVVK